MKPLNWICADCGGKYGKYLPDAATWHTGKCDNCGKNNIAVTEPRDYGITMEDVE